MSKESFDVIHFQQEFNHISPVDLDDILESLADKGYLSDKGIKFRDYFWKMFIKSL